MKFVFNNYSYGIILFYLQSLLSLLFFHENINRLKNENERKHINLIDLCQKN